MTTFHYERTRVKSKDLELALNEYGCAGLRAVYLQKTDDGSEFDVIFEHEQSPELVAAELSVAELLPPTVNITVNMTGSDPSAVADAVQSALYRALSQQVRFAGPAESDKGADACLSGNCRCAIHATDGHPEPAELVKVMNADRQRVSADLEARAARQREGDEAVAKMMAEQSGDGAKVHGY